MTPGQVDEGLKRSQMRLSAAVMCHNGALEEYLGSLRVGTPKEREDRRQRSVGAFEALLDAHDINVWWILHSYGIDPDRR